MPLSRVELFDSPSQVVDDAVPLGVILPPEFDQAGTPLPLCIFLHGGGGDRSMAVEMQPLFDTLWETETMMPMVIVSPSTGPLSWYAGAWEPLYKGTTGHYEAVLGPCTVTFNDQYILDFKV